MNYSLSPPSAPPTEVMQNTVAPAQRVQNQYQTSHVVRAKGRAGAVAGMDVGWQPPCRCHLMVNECTFDVNDSEEDEEVTSHDLSWQRLHISRAKLKSSATTSELFAGFAMVALVEIQIDITTDIPEWLMILYSVSTTVLVAVHIFALMISTYILPNIDAVSKLHVRGMISESPHDRMRSFIELAWAFSTVFGLFLFLFEMAVLCWMKFWDHCFAAAWGGTIVVVPVLVLFIAFTVHFYHSLVVTRVQDATQELALLEKLKNKLNDKTSFV